MADDQAKTDEQLARELQAEEVAAALNEPPPAPDG